MRRGVAQGERREHVAADVRVDRHERRLLGGLGLTELPKRGRLGGRGDLAPLGVGLRGDERGRRGLLRLAPLVRALLSHELLAAGGELDLARELVLSDLALPLDSDGATLVGRTVGLRLEPLADGRAQGLLDVALGPDGEHPDAEDLDAGRDQSRVLAERAERRPHAPHAGLQRLGQVDRGDQVDREALRELAHDGPDLLPAARLLPLARHGEDAEVQALGREDRVAEPVGHVRLHGDVLLVARHRVEQDGQLLVGGGHLAEHRGVGPEPERLAHPLVPHVALAEVHHVVARGAQELPESGVALDRRHRRPLVRCCRQFDDIYSLGFSSR